ncbi:MAG TPA: hypothetical protein ENI42_01055 [Thermoplasmatales archaeon]|nr:hypothetical protein [Thermoplasmatales archaeon]
MHDITRLIGGVKRYQNVFVQREFKSKRNTVACVVLEGKLRVLKWFAPAFKNGLLNEYQVLKQGSSSLNMPHPYEVDMENSVLILGFIDGENLCDLINNEDVSFGEKQRLMVLLADWFAGFHRFFRGNEGFRIHGDSVLRNFLFSDRIWGVDFEDSRRGKPVEDVAGVCASILSSDPMFTTEKFLLCKTFVESYVRLVDWKVEDVGEETAYKLLEKIQWRPEHEKVLKTYAEVIREQGLPVGLL